MTLLVNHSRTRGHTLVELVAALFASALLLAGLGSVMLIARQIAYTPTAATGRLEAAKIVSELADELQLATYVTQRSATLLEFVVADRDGDGAEERIRYEWSGTPGDPLLRSQNGGGLLAVADAVLDFDLAYTVQDVVTPIETTTDSAEVILRQNTTLQSSGTRDITSTNWAAQTIDPDDADFNWITPPPADALHWNATRVEFQGATSGATTGTLLVQLCPAGELYSSPTSHVLREKQIAESSLSTSLNWSSASFATPARELALHRKYAIVWATASSSAAGRLRIDSLSSRGVLESTDGGASWQKPDPEKQLYYRLYGTYTTPGPTYNITRNYLSNVAVRLQTSAQTHSRVDASVALANLPELLSAYWRTDFDTDPTASDVNGDGTADWIEGESIGVVGAVPYDASSVEGGTWRSKGLLRTQPLNDFANPTTVEVRFRDSSVGGNGCITWINADWGNGQAATLALGVLLNDTDTQSFWMTGQTSSSTWVELLKQESLSAEFVRCRLTILPEHNLVNVQINDTDVGTFTYPTYPLSSDERFLSVEGDTDTAKFDYVEVRVSDSN